MPRLGGPNARAYLSALLAPMLATPPAWLAYAYLHPANLALIYLAAVIIAAAFTGTRPALVSALASFLLYNLLFTEPRFTLRMIHDEEILTVGLFLLMAAVTGQLAARLREQVTALRDSNSLNNAQIALSRRLAAALSVRDVARIVAEELATIAGTPAYAVLRPQANAAAELIATDDHGTGSVPDLSSIDWESGSTGSPDPEDQWTWLPMRDGERVMALATCNAPGRPAVRQRLSRVREAFGYQARLALDRVAASAQLENERVEKERELLRSALLSSVSHDLRTPLASMIGAITSLMELREALTEEQKQELEQSIYDEATRLDSYVQKLLDMTRLGHGSLPLDRDWIALDDILHAAIKRIRPPQRELELDIDRPGELPLLYVHPALIEQALFNILENAAELMGPGGRITIRARHEGQHLVVDILDTGPGIAPEDRERIFDKFYTASRGDRRRAGTGLGLTISRGICMAHGGTVTAVDPPAGYNACIRVSLPAEQPQ